MAEREERVEYTLFGKNLYSTSIFSEKWRWARQYSAVVTGEKMPSLAIFQHYSDSGRKAILS
jgi:hypothetical protein